MNKGFYYFTFAFLTAFAASFTFWQAQPRERIPASVDDTAAQDRRKAAADLAMAQINTIYTQAILNENSLAQGSAVYDKALEQSIQSRQQQMAANPNGFIWPGNPADVQYSQLMQSKYAIQRDRQHGLTYAGMQMLLIMKQNEGNLSPEQKSEIYAKYLQLSNMVTASSSGQLYSWPLANDPYLLNVSQTNALGLQPVALNATNTCNPVTGMCSPAPVSTDFPVGGFQNIIQPQPTLVDPVFEAGTVAQ